MKLLFTSAFLFITAISLTAKNDTIPADSGATRQYTKRNEIYLSITPALIPMIGGSSELVKYALKYKIHDKSLNHAFRIGLNYMKTDYPVLYKQYLYDHDSTMVFQKVSSSSFSNIWIDFGWEFSQYYKRFERFYGVDMVLGHYKSMTSLHQETYTIINNLYQESYYENINYTYTANRIGISPFFGLKYHLTQHFLFSMQVGVDLSYNISHSTNTKIGNSDSSGLDFKLGTPAFINDISIVYNF